MTRPTEDLMDVYLRLWTRVYDGALDGKHVPTVVMNFHAGLDYPLDETRARTEIVDATVKAADVLARRLQALTRDVTAFTVALRNEATKRG